MAQARRRRYLAGTPRPVAPLEPVPGDVEPVPADVKRLDQNLGDQNGADDVAVPVDEVPAIPKEQNAENLDDSNDQPRPTRRGQRRRRLPASLRPGGDFIVPPTRRPRLDSNAASAIVAGRVRGQRQHLGTHTVRC